MMYTVESWQPGDPRLQGISQESALDYLIISSTEAWVQKSIRSKANL